MSGILPRVGDEWYHAEAGWVSIAAVYHHPITYCECIAEDGRRFSAVRSALYRDGSLFGDREMDLWL